MAKLTNNLMVQLYLGFADDYKKLQDENKTPQEIYEYLHKNLFFSFGSPFSSLRDLEKTDQIRALHALETFITASPLYRTLSPGEMSQFSFIQNQPIQISFINDSRHYCDNHDTIFTWMMLSSIMSHSHGHKHRGGCGSGKGDNSNNAGQILALLLLVVLGLMAAFVTLISAYYIFSQFLNSMERFLYNEGWFKATMTLASMIAGAAAGAFLGTFIASVPIIALSIAAGLSNPLGMAILGIVCITFITAAISCGITNWVHNKAIEKMNKDALDPKDPYRFKISASDAKKMLANRIDPDKALLAIIAIRQQMGKENVPSLLNRMFTTTGKEKQELLQLVRAIRSGAVKDVKVGEMVFNLRQEPYLTDRFVPSYSSVQPSISFYHPSHPALVHGHPSNPYGEQPQHLPYSEQEQPYYPHYEGGSGCQVDLSPNIGPFPPPGGYYNPSQVYTDPTSSVAFK